jgi:hypothetical protein
LALDLSETMSATIEIEGEETPALAWEFLLISFTE